MLLASFLLSDMFQFVEDIRELDFNEADISVLYDVSALFTNVPLEETIQILANKAINKNWFNEKQSTLTSPKMTCFNSTVVLMHKLME